MRGSLSLATDLIFLAASWTLRASLIFSCRIKRLYSDEVSEPHSGRIFGPIGQVETRRRAAREKTTSHAASRCSSAYHFPGKNEGKFES